MKKKHNLLACVVVYIGYLLLACLCTSLIGCFIVGEYVSYQEFFCQNDLTHYPHFYLCLCELFAMIANVFISMITFISIVVGAHTLWVWAKENC